MDLLIVAASAVLGFAALFAAVYTQNWFAGVAVLGIGTLVLFGTTAGGSPGPVIENFFETVGVEGFIAAVVGAVLGGYTADRVKARSTTS